MLKKVDISCGATSSYELNYGENRSLMKTSDEDQLPCDFEDSSAESSEEILESNTPCKSK